MTPQVPSVLAEFAGLVLRNADPQVAAAERTSALTLAAMVLSVAAEVSDGEAENLVQENRALAALLGDASSEANLRLTALRAENARLRALLIAAQVDAEAAGDTARQDAIWAELRASTERRLLSISLV
ncbi:MAG TPA: hypothetical protein VFE18_20645 [Phenylobacterium sp.]|jgi:hypothetical protein|uniref:hypothetical protein n=1 Tax=Phenylobacterium sp. TaxID=1871053 RepID=UPI002D59114E|nr:hypothetical protein [Phenylobacterium sp.]HZZ70586.1 hypothetical protein [Phenylobacterium sp.]